MFDSDRFKILCKRNGTSGSYIASRLGKTRSFFTDLKNGKFNISDTDLEIVAAALHTTPAYLMGETDDPSEGTKKEPATGEGDGLEKQLIAFYGEVKSYLDEDDLNDIKIFMQMKADYKKRKMMENHDKG